MSLPRQIVPGRVYLVTRRCTQRQFLLRPDPETTNAFIYCLGYAAQRSGIKVIAFLASSNHYHAVVIDEEGRIPTFLEDFHRPVARHQNRLRKRRENLWSTEQTSLVELIGDATILAKVIYTLANPVKDHLVEKATHWPGASSFQATVFGKVLVARRPLRFFRRDGEMPATVQLRCHRIPGLKDVAADAYARTLIEGIRQVELTASAERKRTGRTLLGRKAVLAQPPENRPGSVEVKRPIRAKVSSALPHLLAEAIDRLKSFRNAYAASREAWLRSEKTTFPLGTWWLSRFAAVDCEPYLQAA
ncbi:MAG TPA: hypothetical protein VGF45_04145 [Polyangia bacterium]